jgi:pilus assembly protein CpaB
MKQKWMFGIAIVVGILAFMLSHAYLRKERERLYAGAEQVKVVAAAVDLPAGTVLRNEDIGTVSVYKTAIGNQAIFPDDAAMIIGKRLSLPVNRREPVLWSSVEMPERMRGGLSTMVKPGLRAVSLGIGGVSAVSGLVQPNDRVDILGTFSFPSEVNPAQMETVTLTILQDVTILATGTRLARPDMFGASSADVRSVGYSMVTIEATPREVELLVFAEHMKGQLSLALRNPDDVGFERETPRVNFEHMERIMPELNQYRQRTIRHKSEP